MIRTRFLSKSFIVLAMLTATTAQAQYTPNFNYLAPTQLWTVDTVTDYPSSEDAVDALRLQGAQQGLNLAQDSEAQVVQKMGALVHFTPSAARRQANIKKFVERMRGVNPQAGDQLATAFKSQDAFAAVDGAISQYGMSSNSVADAYTLFWITSWEASQGIVDGKPDAEATAAVRKQSLLAIMATPGFAKFSDAKKQDMADEYVMVSFVLSASMDYLAQNRSEIPAYKKNVLDLNRAAGLDLASMKLTKEGFVDSGRKTGDAGDIMDDGERLAGSDKGLGTTQLAMIAAAGAGGLGAVLLMFKGRTGKG